MVDVHFRNSNNKIKALIFIDQQIKIRCSKMVFVPPELVS